MAQHLEDIANMIEQQLEKLGQFENKPPKISTQAINMVLFRKIQTEMLQGRLLELRSDLIRSGSFQAEICDPNIIVLERLFSENGLHVYSYVTNFLITLMRRVALGKDYVGCQNAKMIIDLHSEVSKKYYQREFELFKPIFKSLLVKGVTVSEWIYIEAHQYLSFHYLAHGPKSLGILMRAKYLKLKYQFQMYEKIGYILIDILHLTLHALSYDLCMFKQARHLLSVVYTNINRLEQNPNNAKEPVKQKLATLKQLTICIEAFYFAVNLQKSKQTNIIDNFFDKVERFKDDEVQDIDLPIRLARNKDEMAIWYEKIVLLKSVVTVKELSQLMDQIIGSINI